MMSGNTYFDAWGEALAETPDWEENISTLWGENDTPSVFTVPVGVDRETGDVVQVTIDQFEFAHGAVYGGVGVGKSVALNTLLTGLGVKYPPGVVEFVFSSGKGSPVGASQLPHTREMFDVASDGQVEAFSEYVERLLEDRQRVAEQRGLSLVQPSDLPAVFIVVEEVSGVEGLDGVLEDVVRRGRSLGVHLILVGQHVNERGFSSEIVGGLGWAIAFRPSDGDAFSDNVSELSENVVPGEGFLLSQSSGEAVRVFHLEGWEGVLQGQKG